MSLFDKLKYRLNEEKKSSSGNNSSNENLSTSRKRIKKAIEDLDDTQPKKMSKTASQNLDKQISQTRTVADNQKQRFDRQYDAYDDGDLGNPSQSKTVTPNKNTKPTETKKNTKPINKKKSLEIQKKSLVKKTKKYVKGEYPKVGGGERKTITKTGNTSVKVGDSNVNIDPKPNKSKGSGTGSRTVQPNINPKKRITGNYSQSTATKYTNKINRANPNRPEYVPQKTYDQAIKDTQRANPGQTRPLGTLVKKTKTASDGTVLKPGQIDFTKAGELAAKRKARIDPKTGGATSDGVFDYLTSRKGMRRLSQGMSKSQFKNYLTKNPKAMTQFKRIVTSAKNVVKNPGGNKYKRIAAIIANSDYAGKIAKPIIQRVKKDQTIKKKLSTEIPKTKAQIRKIDKIFDKQKNEIKKVYGDKVVTTRQGSTSIRGSASQNPLPEIKPSKTRNLGYKQILQQTKGKILDGTKLKNLSTRQKVYKILKQIGSKAKTKKNLKTLTQKNYIKAIPVVALAGAGASKFIPAGAFRKEPPTSVRPVLDKKTGKQAKFDDFKDTKMPATEFNKLYKVGPKKKSN